MKYRKGLTNIGIICGFATAEADGRIAIHHTSSREIAFLLLLAEGARVPEYGYEPVTVLYRVIPNGDGADATLEALHVTRMARYMMPRTFYWNSREWPRSLDFYPFLASKAGTLIPEIEQALADEHDFPAWIEDAAAGDDSFAALLKGPTSQKHLPNRLLITGTLQPGEIVPMPRDKEAHDYLRVWLYQGKGDAPIGLRMPPGTQGFHYMADHRCPPGGVPTTVLAKPIQSFSFDSGTVSNQHLDFLLLEASAVTSSDIAV